MAAAAAKYDWDLELGELATIWRGGCIIRARFLNRITDAYAEQPDLVNLLMAPYFRDAVADAQDAWRTGDRRARSSRASPSRRSAPRWPTTTATGASAARRT